MSCDTLTPEDLEAYAFGELDERGATRVLLHVATCTCCGEDLRRLRAERRMFAARAAVATPEVPSFEAVFARLSSDQATVEASVEADGALDRVSLFTAESASGSLLSDARLSRDSRDARDARAREARDGRDRTSFTMLVAAALAMAAGVASVIYVQTKGTNDGGRPAPHANDLAARTNGNAEPVDEEGMSAPEGASPLITAEACVASPTRTHVPTRPASFHVGESACVEVVQVACNDVDVSACVCEGGD
jgi:hypothetical protein